MAIPAAHSITAIALSLPRELQQLADHQIASGKYTSLDEILMAVLQAHADHEQIYHEHFEELRSEIFLGADQAERGDLLDTSSEIDAIHQCLRSRYL